MRMILSTLKKILFWSYERGSWQYDVMCVLILAFVFFGSNSVFHSHRSSRADESTSGPIYVDAREVGDGDQAHLNERILKCLSRKYGHDVEAGRILRVVDESGSLAGYDVWEK